MKHIILRHLEVHGGLVLYKFEVSDSLTKLFNAKILWIDFGEDVSEVSPSILTIPFVSIMLPIVWLAGARLWVKDLDRTFYRSLSRLKLAYQDLYTLSPLKGMVIPCNLLINELGEHNDRSFLLFSGGVDAHASFLRNNKHISDLINIQGWYNDRGDTIKAAERDKLDIDLFAREHSKRFHFVRSNFARLINHKSFDSYARVMKDSLWHGMQHSMAFISLSIPLACKWKAKVIYIASSFTIGDERVCASYPTTDTEFDFATSGHTIHDAFELNRQEKIKLLIDHQHETETPYPIRVCSFNDKNCGTCEKCFRTVAALVAEGADPNMFGFDIQGDLTVL